MAKGKTIHVRVSEHENELIERAAAESWMSLSEWIRTSLVTDAECMLPPAEAGSGDQIVVSDDLPPTADVDCVELDCLPDTADTAEAVAEKLAKLPKSKDDSGVRTWKCYCPPGGGCIRMFGGGKCTRCERPYPGVKPKGA